MSELSSGEKLSKNQLNDPLVEAEDIKSEPGEAHRSDDDNFDCDNDDEIVGNNVGVDVSEGEHIKKHDALAMNIETGKSQNLVDQKSKLQSMITAADLTTESEYSHSITNQTFNSDENPTKVSDSKFSDKPIIATPTPNRSIFHRQLKSEFTPPIDESSPAEQFPNTPYRNYLDTTEFKSDDSLETNSSIIPTPTPVGLLSLPRSPMLADSAISSPRGSVLSPPKSPRMDSSTTPSPRTPKAARSPNLSSTNITPITSNEDYVIYSDSDNASQSSVELKDKQRRRVKRDDSTSATKPKKRLRRKSNKSDNTSITMGTGYTSIPGTGKIFRNLLILEESLRQQVIQQRALRRKYLIFLTILFSLIITVSHHLFLTNSKYTSTGTRRVLLQLTLLALLMTLFLYHLSGEYQKTIVLPRKFLSTTNKGLRQLNIRLVKIVTPWTDSFTDLIREISLYIIAGCLNAFHKVSEKSIKNKNSKIEVFLVSCQSQCQPRIGVTDVKLVLNTRVFNTDIREGWELYRSEFWINEGVRRRQQMMAFVNEESSKESKEILARSKLLKKDKKERRERRRSNPPKLNESNLESLANGLASNERIPE